MLFVLPLVHRGKNPPQIRRRWPLSAPVGCLSRRINSVPVAGALAGTLRVGRTSRRRSRRAREYQAAKQFQSRFGFVGLLVDSSLAQRTARRLIQNTQQMDGSTGRLKCAAQRFPVEGHRRQFRGGQFLGQAALDPTLNRAPTAGPTTASTACERRSSAAVGACNPVRAKTAHPDCESTGQWPNSLVPLVKRAHNCSQHGHPRMAQSLRPRGSGICRRYSSKLPAGAGLKQSPP